MIIPAIDKVCPMPELPEVEVTRLSFAPAIAGANILNVQVGKPLRWPLSCQTDALIGRQVLQVRLPGKYLLLDLSRGILLVHLGMSGSLTFAAQAPPAGKHDHFDLLTSHGLLRLHDPRRFGAVVYVDSESDALAIKLLGRLGGEPLEDSFDPIAFASGLKKKTAPVKQVLLAGELVVGVGNIYASEALFLAGIRPATRASRISKPRAFKLHQAIREVLASAVEKGGSSLRDFSNAQGQNGYFQLQANVYDRAGLPCRICAAPIKRLVQGQRSSFYCPLCQKP
jgi:formamidopyrimidine-DNA glycosylase